MSIASNRALVSSFYQLMSELQFDRMFDLMASDAMWIVAGNPKTFRHAGACTKQQRREGFANFVKAFSSLTQSVVTMRAEEDRVAVEARTRCVTHQGLVYENELLILLHCKEGQITRIYEHLDQLTSIAFEAELHQSLQAGGRAAHSSAAGH